MNIVIKIGNEDGLSYGVRSWCGYGFLFKKNSDGRGRKGVFSAGVVKRIE